MLQPKSSLRAFCLSMGLAVPLYLLHAHRHTSRKTCSCAWYRVPTTGVMCNTRDTELDAV